MFECFVNSQSSVGMISRRHHQQAPRPLRELSNPIASKLSLSHHNPLADARAMLAQHNQSPSSRLEWPGRSGREFVLFAQRRIP